MSASVASTATANRESINDQLRIRRVANQLSRVGLVLLGALTPVVFIVAFVQAFLWLQQPVFLGVFVEYPTLVERGAAQPFFGEAEEVQDSALQQGDTILSMNGVSVANGRQIMDVLENRSPGDQVVLDVVGADGNRRTIDVTLSPIPFSRTLLVFSLLSVAALGHIGLGLWVSRQRRGQPVGRIFLMYSLAGGILLIGLFDLWTTHTLVPVWLTALTLMGVLLLSLALIFPGELVPVARQPMLRFVPPLLAVPVLIYLTVTFLAPNAAPPGRIWQVEGIFTALCIVITIFTLGWRAILAKSPAILEQSRVVLAGALLAFAPFVLFVLDDSVVRLGWVALSFLLFPATIAYSIVQYNALDTKRLFSFTATYGLIVLAATAGYAVLVAGINLIVNGALLMGASDIASNPVLVALFTIGLVLALQPARKRLQSTIDGLFFRAEAEYEKRLTAFRQELTVASGLSDVIRLLKSQIRETLMPSHIYIFLRDAQSADFVAHGEGARPDTDIRFETGGGLVHALSTTRDVLFLEYNKPLPPELVEEHARLAVLRTPVLAPLQGQERLAGWVAVAHKRSGERYSIQDLRFIQALAEQASLAVERAQVIGDLERRVRELDVLSQVSQAVNFTADPDVLLELIYTQTGKLIDTTNFYIILHRPEVNALTYGFFLEGHERFEQNEGRAFRDNIGLEGEVIRTGRPIRTDDYLAECARRGVQARPESKHYAWMGVPLNAGNETLGAMVVASFIPGVTFTDEQLKVFWAIADQAATALDKARLFRETEVRALQLQSLNEISTQLSSTLDLENLLSRIMRSAVEILQCDAGSLFLVDEDTGDLVFRVVEGGAQDLVGQRIQWGMGIVGQVAETREPVIVHNVSEDTRWLRDLDEQTEFETESILAVPLLIHDESLGVLEVINKRDGSPFTGDDIALLTTFAGQAAVAIENARLYEATDAALSARVDELQNLQRIDRELNRTLNFDRVLSITLDWALRVTGASAGMIAMLPAEGEGLQIAVSQGYRDDFIAEYSEKPLPLSMGIAGRVMSTGTPEFSADATEDEQFVNVAKQPSVAQITVPILRANTPIGILVIESSIPGLFSTTDFEFIQRLVEHAAVAIENARLVQGIERANLEKTDLMRTIAHELNNPMTSIKGYTDLLLTGAISEDMQNQFLNTIRNNTDRMRRIVDDLRDVAHIDSGQLKLQRTAVDPVAPVDVTVRSLQSLIEDKEQHLEMHIEDDLPPIYADNTRLEQIMTNLISNAHKYTPEGGTIEIRATLETVTDEATGQQQDVVHYVVRDTGIGMSEDDLAQLFTKFFRTQRGKEMAKGTGLGLVITKSLVEDHGGQIWVESEVGVGTTFHFTIPAADVPETEEGTTAG